MADYILGIHNGVESGVCVLKDGELLEAVSEERHNRIKVFAGIPAESVAYVMEKFSILPEDVHSVVYSRVTFKPDLSSYLAKYVRRVCSSMQNDPETAGALIRRMDTELEDSVFLREFEEWMDTLGIGREKIHYLDHHLAHVWSAFSCSPFERALVITADGRGDFKSATVSLADTKNGVKELDYMLTLDSLGFLYGQITAYLGFRPHRHEGKVTGLAAFGDPEKTLPVFRQLVDWDEGKGCWETNLSLYAPHNRNPNEAFAKLMEPYSREDIAAGVQQHCENLVVAYVRHWLNKLGSDAPAHICLAGGIFANVKINQRVAEIEGVENIFVFPCMGDGGLTAGGACYGEYLRTGETKVPLPTVYLGSGFDSHEIEDALRAHADKLDYTRMDKRAETIAELLDDGVVVGYFDGRMEYGPRALGARTILVNPRDKAINDSLNHRLQRTEFMPFAPVTPEDFAAECYVAWKPEDVSAHFMTRTYDCEPSFIEKHPAVVHIDGTARPQVIRREHNERYYDVVMAYCQRTGERALINTSFNAHEEPIIRTPAEALNSLIQDRVDVLVCGDFLVKRKV